MIIRIRIRIRIRITMITIIHLSVFGAFLSKGEVVPRAREDFPPRDHSAPGPGLGPGPGPGPGSPPGIPPENQICQIHRLSK